MPTLKNRMIFISHAWAYSDHYNSVVRWLDDAPNFIWSNCSVPSTDSLPGRTSGDLSRGMTRQISPAQVVLILGGMYAAHSGWIEYEVSEARRMGKTIIGIKPWGQERVPLIVQNSSICEPVGWNRASVVDAVRTYS